MTAETMTPFTPSKAKPKRGRVPTSPDGERMTVVTIRMSRDLREKVSYIWRNDMRYGSMSAVIVAFVEAGAPAALAKIAKARGKPI